MGMGHRAGAYPVPQHWAYVRARASEERRLCENLMRPAAWPGRLRSQSLLWSSVVPSHPQHTHSLLGEKCPEP